MAAEISVDSFLDLLRQSGLVSDNPMLALAAEFGGENAKSHTARSVADELVKRGVLTEWQADNLMQGKHRGFFLGPHRILRPLGQGGMSRVFLAEHEMMRRRCAIKILPSKHQADPDLLMRFRLEARAIAALDHPHIVRAYDFNKDVKYGKDIDYLVMEYVEGQDLRRMIEEQGPLDYRKAADYISQAAEGLAHAHECGLVHRDVKPANLLVDPNGVLKILDLGLARVTFEGEEAWQTPEGEQSAVGTADYVAPEQVMDSRSVDGRADIYSLGFTFYYLLTGRRPFPKSTLVELLMAHRVETPEPIIKLRPDVPLELVDIIDRMTAKTPDLRFQTAKEVAERLQAWVHDSGSGREYSRISALMAAAMRPKQSGPEDALAKTEPMKDADLELAFLDEDVTAPARPAPARPTPARPPSAPGHRAESQKSTESKKLKPGDSGKTAALPKAQADLLSEIIPDQERLAPVVLPQFKRPTKIGKVWMSPWLWIGLAGIVFVVLLIFAILFGSSASKPSRQTARNTPAEKTVQSTTSSAPSPQASPRSPADKADVKKESPKPAPAVVETPAPVKAAEQPSAQPSNTSPTPMPEPVVTKPKEESTPAATQPAAPPATQPATPPATQPATTPSPPQADELSVTEKLLASLTTIRFHFTPSDAESNSRLNVIIGRQAIDAAKVGLHLAIDEKSPNVMNVDIKAVSGGELFTVDLSAELVCTGSDGKTVTAWKQSKQILSINPRAARPDRVLRPAAVKFFEQFTDEVRRARSKSKSK